MANLGVTVGGVFYALTGDTLPGNLSVGGNLGVSSSGTLTAPAVIAAPAPIAVTAELNLQAKATAQQITKQTAHEAHTSSYTAVSGSDSAKLLSSLGATGTVPFTLPSSPVPGDEYEFKHASGTGIQVTIPANHYILDGYGAQNYGGTTAKTISHSGVYAHLKVKYMGVDASLNHLWHLAEKSGTWS